jgi:RNA-directed DNA polymerase
MHKWYSLIDKVYDMTNLHESYTLVRKNKGGQTKGIDGITAKHYGENLSRNLCQLREELKSGRYKPDAVRRVYIKKPDGSDRPLGIPTIKDRVVQQALRKVLEPIFEPTFHPSSYGYRPKKSAHHAIAKSECFARHYGLENVVDMDLSKCFDTLDHDLIIASVGRRVSDGKVLKLIKDMLVSGIMENGDYLPTDKGSPQGGIISPLFANIYLDRFDQHMKSLGIRIVRYADDILIFSRSRSEAGKNRAIATSYLEKELKLRVNKDKTHLTNLRKGIPYLGIVLTQYGVMMSKKSIKRFKDKVRKLTPRRMGHKLADYVYELNMLLKGFSMYYRIARSKKQFRNLISWVRRRLRMMMMISWKSWKGLHKQLRRVGYKGVFEKISMSRWRNSSCQLLHMALSNKYFHEHLFLFDLERVKTNILHQYYGIVLNKV